MHLWGHGPTFPRWDEHPLMTLGLTPSLTPSLTLPMDLALQPHKMLMTFLMKIRSWTLEIYGNPSS